MNFFFKLNAKNYDYNLTVPRFTNYGKVLNKLNLYSLSVTNNKHLNYWHYKKINSTDDNFFSIKKSNKINEDFFFLGTKKICEDLFNSDKTEIKPINNFLNLNPPFRSNTKIMKKNFGFSSYQSDYPISMTNKKGSIVSPIQTLLNYNAEINKIFLVNIYYKPIKDSFRYYLINYKTKKIIFSDVIYTNTVNEINIDKAYIEKDIFFVTKKYVGIPIFFSDKKGHLSLEHTHPPHEYVFGKNKYKIITDFKREFNEIIDQENL